MVGLDWKQSLGPGQRSHLIFQFDQQLCERTQAWKFQREDSMSEASYLLVGPLRMSANSTPYAKECSSCMESGLLNIPLYLERPLTPRYVLKFMQSTQVIFIPLFCLV